MAVCALLKFPKLISRKIWVTEKSCNFHSSVIDFVFMTSKVMSLSATLAALPRPALREHIIVNSTWSSLLIWYYILKLQWLKSEKTTKVGWSSRNVISRKIIVLAFCMHVLIVFAYWMRLLTFWNFACSLRHFDFT